MKLRTRLFLSVGLIFVLAFAMSLFLDTYSTENNLDQARQVLYAKILNAKEKQRQSIEKYLHTDVSEDQAQIDSLLLRITRDPGFGSALFLEGADPQLTAPVHSASLFRNDRWIDFIQTTKNGELTSLFTPIVFPMHIAYEVPIDPHLSWVVTQSDPDQEHLFIGVKVVGDLDTKPNLSFLVDELIELDWRSTIFFDPEALVHFVPPSIPAEKDEAVKDGIHLSNMLQAISYAASYLKGLKEKSTSPSWAHSDFRAKAKQIHFNSAPPDYGILCLEQEGETLNDRIIELVQRGDQAMMISSLTSLLPGGYFGDSPFAPMAPKGVARFPQLGYPGYYVPTDRVFHPHILFNDAEYFKKHPSTKGCKGIASSIAVIAAPTLGQVFIGNTLGIENPKTGQTEGFLTIGIDINRRVEDLVLSSGKIAFLVHDNKVISAFAESGDQMENPEIIPLNPEMLTQYSGILKWDNLRYYFIHMQPFPGMDLHFFLLEPAYEAFSLADSVEAGSRLVIKQVSFNMQLIAGTALVTVLIFLHFVSRKITSPIVSLAKMTEDVAAGKLEGLTLPEAPKGRQDEIASLCQSFEKMVIGLREKEKVKGILNKVVSPEIAQEISKGTVQLGGETRKVTVLFADIRNFTGMSAHMAPQQVVELLNGCMTTISHIIDEFGGVIDKYVGDEVMALFGAPIASETSALKAVQSGLKMVEALNAWNKTRAAEHKPPVEMGIGIHTGEVLVGNMGAENRLNYTVIGSNVNLASRLCSAAKGMEILISEATLNEPGVKEAFHVEPLAPLMLKGFTQPVVVFRIRGGA